MATTGILFKGKIYAFSDEYPPELEESLKAQGMNRFGQKTTLNSEEQARLNKGNVAPDKGKLAVNPPRGREAQ